MPRINLDLDFLTHPKTISITPLAQLLFIRSILYSARHLTDGFIPAGAISHLTCDMQYDRSSQTIANGVALHAAYGHEVESTDLAQELESVGWWVKITGGYDIHDFLEYQLSRRQVQQLSNKHKQSGKKGGLAKALANSKPTPSQTVANVYPLTNPNPNPKIEDEEKKKMPIRASVVVENEWIEDLKKNPAYLHINWVVEWGKMDAWLSKPANRHRKRTQSFILNWINKIEAPIDTIKKPRQVVL